MNPVIREADESAIGQIRQIAQTTWPVSYKDMISSSQIEYMLEMMYSEDSLLEQFEAGIRFLICYLNELPVGFAGAGPKDNTMEIWRLEKLYVLPDYQSKGLGKLLLEEVIQMAKTAGFTRLELNVNRTNRAQEFYRRQGFEIHESVDVPIGEGFFMNDYILHKIIS